MPVTYYLIHIFYRWIILSVYHCGKLQFYFTLITINIFITNDLGIIPYGHIQFILAMVMYIVLFFSYYLWLMHFFIIIFDLKSTCFRV